MDLIKTLTAQYMKPELPAMRVGDTVRVCKCFQRKICISSV